MIVVSSVTVGRFVPALSRSGTLNKIMIKRLIRMIDASRMTIAFQIRRERRVLIASGSLVLVYWLRLLLTTYAGADYFSVCLV